MRIACIGCILSLFATAAFGQNQILIQREPQYKPGESYKGLITLHTGESANFHQEAFRGPDGLMYVLGTITSVDGQLVGRGVMDPRTWSFQSTFGDQKTTLLSTTCSNADMYPIVLNKKYECASLIKINDKTLKSVMRIQMSSVQKDARNSVVAVCGVQESDDDDLFTKVRLCMSRDAKWIREMHYIEVTPRSAI